MKTAWRILNTVCTLFNVSMMLTFIWCLEPPDPPAFFAWLPTHYWTDFTRGLLVMASVGMLLEVLSSIWPDESQHP